MTTTDIIKDIKYQPLNTVRAIKDDKRRKEIQNTAKTIINIKNKKIKDFVNVYKIAVNHTYEIEDPILIRHSLLETVEK